MNNVHPRILGSILSRLQEGSVIKSAASVSEDYAEFQVEQDGVVRALTVPKVDVYTYLAGQTIEVMAKEGDIWETILERVSVKYRLFLVPGVDYETDTSTIEFGDGNQIIKMYEILPDSISLKGAVTARVLNSALHARPTIAVCCALDEQKTQLALVSKVFPSHQILIVGAGGLPSGFCDGLVDHLTELGVHYIPSAEDLGLAEVVDLINDGVSDLAVVKTPDEHLWFVRYRLLSASGEAATG